MKRAGPVIHHRSFYTNFVLMEPYFIYMRADLQCYMCVKEVYCHFPYDCTWNNALSSWLSYLCNHQFSSDNGLAMRRNISNVGTLRDRRAAVWAPRRSIAFRNSAGTWSRAPGKQFGVLDRWRDRHTRPARWSDTLRIRPVRWRKWNRIRIDLARLADPITANLRDCNDRGKEASGMVNIHGKVEHLNYFSLYIYRIRLSTV